jgi:hypothetical protein
MAIYLIPNGPSPTTAAQAPVATGTSIFTALQVKPGASATARIIEWGISFDAFVAAAPIKCELLEADVAATVTAHAASGIVKWDAAALLGGDPTTDLFPVGTAATGYTATVEGTITAVRMFDVQFVAPTNQYIKQFAVGERPVIQLSKFARVRVTAPADVDCYTYMLVEV